MGINPDELQIIQEMLYERLFPRLMEMGNTETGIKLWFDDLRIISLKETEATFSTPADYKKKTLTQRFAVYIAECLSEILGYELDVVIHSSQHEESELSSKSIETFDKIKRGEINDPAEKQKISIPDNFSTDYTFENFIVGASNKMAHSAALAVASQDLDSPNRKDYNPLFIYGPSGIGKTHLLYSIVNKITKNNPDKKIIYITGEQFVTQLTEAIQKKSTLQFKEKYRSCDVLLIDDIHIVAGKEATQEEFFNTFNSIYGANKQMIFTSDRPPQEMKSLADRLRTRFMAGLIVDIGVPDFDLRCAVLKQKAMMNRLTISNDIIRFLADNITSSIRQLEGVIRKIGAFQLLQGEEITIETVKNSISEYLPKKDSDFKRMDDIILAVCKKFNVTRDDILSTKRHKEIAMSRHICVYIARQCTNLSQEQIGKFINRDRTTVLSSEKTINEEIERDTSLDYEIKEIIREINGL